MKKSSLKNRPVHPLIEELEPRILFSAGLEGIVLDSLTPDDDAFALYQHKDETILQPTSAVATEAVVLARQELVFIDTNTPDYQKLVDNLLANNEEDRTFQWVLIESNKDGIQQITDSLANYNNLDAVHIISHGSDGTVQLGNNQLNSDSLQANTDAISNWGDAFSEDGDLLFYGCNLAATEDGQSLINSLAKLTGADIAASDNLTGNSELKGDWMLEYSTGVIQSQVAVSQDLQQNWSNILAIGIDNTSTGQTTGSSLTISHLTSGTDLLMLVSVSKTNPGAESVTSITYNGTALTLLGRETTPDTQAQVEIWALTAPDTGTHDVVVTMDGTNASGTIAGVMTFTGVDQTTSLGTFASASNNASPTATVNVSSAAGELVFSAVTAESAPDIALTVGTGQTEHWELYQSGDNNSAGSTEAGAAIVTASWGLPASNQWAIAGVSINPLNNAPIANAGGPYSINEGDPVTLDASASSDPETDPLTYSWDINNDNVFGDITGVSPTLTWAQLQSFGIDDEGIHTIKVRADDGNLTNTASTTITVNNTAPVLSTSGSATVDEGSLYTLNLSISDPGNDSISGWTINWGDGSIDTIVGNPASVTHLYGARGTFNILAAATDEDGTYLQNNLLVGGFIGTNSVLEYEATSGNFLQLIGSLGDGLNLPHSIAQGPDGNLYVSSYSPDSILRYDTAGNFIDIFVTSASGGLNSPTGLTFGADGNLYVSSLSSNEIMRYNGTTGAFIDAFVSASSGGLTTPSGITFGADGNLYVSSLNTNEVLRYDGTTGAFVDAFVSAGSGGLGQPAQLTFGPDSNLYVSSRLDDAVHRYEGATGIYIDTFVTSASGGIDGNAGLAFGPDGNLYVSARDSNDVMRYDGTTGAFIDAYVSAGSGGLSGPGFIMFVAEQQVRVNGVPTDIALSNSTVNENVDTTGGYSVGSLTTSDPDNYESFNYAVVGGADMANFSIGGAGSDELLLDDSILNFETKNSYQVTVRTTDSGGATFNKIFTITVNDLNETPVINNQAFNIDENRPMNNVVGTPVVMDPDTGDSFTYNITGGTGATAFSIHATNGQIRVADPSQINFETNPVLTLDIQVQDAGGLIDTATITININDLNERPTLNDTTFTIDENSVNGTSLGSMVGTDPDGGDSITYSIVGGNIGNAFTIDPVTGEITVNDFSMLNFEAIGIPGNPAFAAQTGAANPFNGINVGNRSTPAFVDIDGDGDLDAFVGEYGGNLNFFENIGDATTPNFVAVSGPGNPLDSVNVTSRSTPTFADIDNDGDQDVFVGHRWGGIAFYENVGSATSPAFVQVTGPGNPMGGVNVVNMSTPTFIDIDGDGDLDSFIGEWYGTVKYFENTGDAANPAFTQQTGAANPLNGVFGGICCNDWQPKPAFADLDDDGDYDAFIGLKNGSTEYWENTGGAATPVFSLQTGDANPLRTVFAGNEAAPAFVDIDNDGDLDVFSGNSFGAIRYFENTPVFNLTVQAEDSSGLTDTAIVRIDLNDVNDGPTDIDLSNNLIDEFIDTTGGYSVGTLSTTDEDDGDNHTYTIVGGADAALFSIGGTGSDELIFDDGILDFETQSSYQVMVRVTDGGSPGLVHDETFTINVNDLNDAPVSNNASASGNEDDTSIAITLTGSDVDGTVDNFQLSTLPANGTLYTDAGLTTVAVTGMDYAATAESLTLYFVPSPNYNGVTNFQFVARDNGGLLDATPAIATITVNPVNDAPVAVDNGSAGMLITTAEDTAVNIDVVGNDTDVDGTIDPTTVVINTGPVNGTININAITGMVSYTPDSNFNGTDTFSYQVRDDSGALSNVASVYLDVTPVNDAPIVTGPATAGTASIWAPLVLSSSNGNAISIADIDDANAIVEVTLAVSNGDLTLSKTTGLSFTTGDGINDTTMTFTGTLADANAALDGLKMQAGDGFQSTDNLTISVNDMGNTGGSPLTASRTITVNIDSLSPNTSDSPDPDSTPSDTDSDPIEVDESEPESNDTPPDPELALEPDTTTQGQQRVLPAGNEASDKPVTESEYVKAIVEKITEIPVDLLESALNKIDIPKSVPQLISNFALWTAIDSMFDELDNSFSDTQTQEAIVANVIRGTTWSLSAGFVAWILRGGSLIAAAMSSIPIWKGLDPLPIIAMSKRERERLEEENLVDKQEEDSLQQEIGELIDGARLVEEQVEDDNSEDLQP